MPDVDPLLKRSARAQHATRQASNVQDQVALTADFICKYKDSIYVQAREEVVKRFTAEDILQDCATAPATAAGWDQWEAADWRNLSQKAAQSLADRLNAI